MTAAWLLVLLPFALIYTMPKIFGWRRPSVRAVAIPFLVVGIIAAAYMWHLRVAPDGLLLMSVTFGSLGALLFHRPWSRLD